MHSLSTYWTLWFHKLNDSDWTINSYVKVCEIKTIESFWETVGTIDSFKYGMWFLMKEDTVPRWEDTIEGGYWSYKISIQICQEAWIKLCAACIGNTIMVNEDDKDLVCGLSFSPKINNCVIKIFNNDAAKHHTERITGEIEELPPADARFKSFKESVELDRVTSNLTKPRG